MIRIKMAPSLDKALEMKERFNGPLATVECEYGNTVVEGAVTLAHHVEGWNTAPSLQTSNVLFEAGVEMVVDGDYIMISHIDLDTVCGIMAVAEDYDIPEDIKKGINYVDCNGQHHLYDTEVSEDARKYILSYIGYANAHRAPIGQEDVTDYVIDLIERFNTQENYEAGKAFVEGRRVEAEASLAGAVGSVVLLDQDVDSKAFGLNSEYILNDVEYDYVIVFDQKFGKITLSSRKGKDDVRNMVDVMRAVFGEEAGGHKGIAGTPRGKMYTLEDAFNLMDIVSRIV